MSMIKVDYAVLENATAQIRSISATIDEKLDSLRSQLQRLEWEGTTVRRTRPTRRSGMPRWRT